MGMKLMAATQLNDMFWFDFVLGEETHRFNVGCIRMSGTESTLLQSKISYMNLSDSDKIESDRMTAFYALALDVVSKRIETMSGFEDENGNPIKLPSDPNSRMTFFDNLFESSVITMKFVIDLFNAYMQVAMSAGVKNEGK